MEISPKEKEFLDYCQKAKKHAQKMKNPLLVHHYDCDRLSAAAIVSAAFLKQGKHMRRWCIKKFDNDAIEKLKQDGEKEIIFVDLGSGNEKINVLSEAGVDIIIIDHHQPVKIEVKFHVNPLLFGIDGGSELSGASTSYLVFRERVDLAIVGAVADQQSPMHGMNRYVLEKGVEKGEIKIEKDLCFYGRYSRPLTQFLAYSDDPYIPGISFREERALDFLGNLNIELKDGDKLRAYADLNVEEKNRLVSAIVEIFANMNMPQKAEELIAESYVFPKHERNETYEANEFSTVLNACGRNNESETGIELCLDGKAGYAEGKRLLELHRRNIRNGIEFALKNTQDFGKFYLLDARNVIDEGIVGIICGIALAHHAKKPILGVSLGEKNTLKFSSRASKALVAEGLNLGMIMRSASEKCGGMGGGHRIAAGASIPAGRINEFLLAVGMEIQ